MTDALKRLSDEGVAIWLDDLSRKRITSGNLAELIDQQHVVGVTTNPSIFQKAISRGDGYDQQLADLAARRVTVEEAIRMITTADVRDAADILRPVYDATRRPGRPGLHRGRPAPGAQHGGDRRRGQAARLAGGPPEHAHQDPGHQGGPARRSPRPSASGISVNVTLIFSLERYREVMDAFLAGLEKAKERGLDLSKIHSVASFFVSRVDTEIDKRLDALGTDEAKALAARPRLANARLAYEAYEEVFGSDRWAALDKAQANKQRPLWASTGVKDPAYKDTLYVDDLVAPDTVNTMPEATLEATDDHGEITGNTVAGTYEQARAELDARREARHLLRRGRAAAGGRGRGEVRGVLERPAQVHRGGARSASPLRRAETLPSTQRTRCVTPQTDGSRASRGRRAWSSSGSPATCPARS